VYVSVCVCVDVYVAVYMWCLVIWWLFFVISRF
jgi:hypothetical protein